MSAYKRYDYGWEFRPPLRTGMGCEGACKCGGKCGGMGDTPTFWQQLTNPIGSNIDILQQQSSDIYSNLMSTVGPIGLGLAGLGLLWVLMGATTGTRRVVKHVRKRRRVARRKAELRQELASL